MPPLDVPADPMVGTYERTLIVEPIEDPVPPSLAHEGEEPPTRRPVRAGKEAT